MKRLYRSTGYRHEFVSLGVQFTVHKWKTEERKYKCISYILIVFGKDSKPFGPYKTNLLRLSYSVVSDDSETDTYILESICILITETQKIAEMLKRLQAFSLRLDRQVTTKKSDSQTTKKSDSQTSVTWKMMECIEF